MYNMNDFSTEVKRGLSAKQKHLSSKYFYDAEGDRIFQQIMAMEEYYLTRAEEEIFSLHGDKLLSLFQGKGKSFNLIEFGAGDAAKTKLLLKFFSRKKADLVYSPIDISANVLEILNENLSIEIPGLKIDAIEGEYFQALGEVQQNGCSRKIILFLGSNIGNFDTDQSLTFLKGIGNKMSNNDLLLIGFDLKKDPGIILGAYNDPHGITASFNMNLLKRINHELGGEFDLEKFYHYACYDPVSGEAKSFLVSKAEQEIKIRAHDHVYYFAKGETIHTEVSRKFSLDDIHQLAIKLGFEVVNEFVDSRGYFVDSIWRLKA
jgi:dimethylhistidine N-methyltransferase